MSGIRQWATKGLASGDLTALRQIAAGRNREDPKRIVRLKARRFIVEKHNGRPRLTFEGRLAALVKRLILR